MGNGSRSGLMGVGGKLGILIGMVKLDQIGKLKDLLNLTLTQCNMAYSDFIMLIFNFSNGIKNIRCKNFVSLYQNLDETVIILLFECSNFVYWS